MGKNKFNVKLYQDKQYANLLIINEAPKKGKATAVNAKCLNCGSVKSYRLYNILSGCNKSCGCLRFVAVSKAQTSHGLSKHPLYGLYRSMLYRCYNKGAKEYHNYGARGIKVCLRWRESFELFLFDMKEKPKGCSLERIDNNGNYEPGNCKWATAYEQRINQRSMLLEYEI